MTPKVKLFSSIHSPRAELDQFRIKNNKMNTLILLFVEWEGGAMVFIGSLFIRILPFICSPLGIWSFLLNFYALGVWSALRIWIEV